MDEAMVLRWVLIVAISCGWFLSCFFLGRKLRRQNLSITRLEQEITTQKELLQTAENRANQSDKDLAAANAHLQAAEQNKKEAADSQNRLRDENANAQKQILDLTQQVSKLTADLQNERETHAAKETQWQDIEKRFVEAFDNLSNKALKTSLEEARQALTVFNDLQAKKQKEITDTELEARKKAISDMIAPLKTGLESLDKNIKQTDTTTIALREIVNQYKDQTFQIGVQAEELAKALKGDSKKQGDWGEMLLARVLETSGLKENDHYQLQATTEHGKYRPDVLFTLPDNRNIILDSKVSLTAYTEYINAKNEKETDDALKRHITSIENHIKELAPENKEYVKTFQKNNKDKEFFEYIIMFIPIEGAYALMMRFKPELWISAYKKKILIVTPTTLLPILHVIYLTWQRWKQERHTKDVMENAAELVDRIYQFLEHQQRTSNKQTRTKAKEDQGRNTGRY